MDHQEWLEHHDRMIADHEIRHDREMAELRASQAKTEQTLRRAIRLSVQESRHQRQRNLEFKQEMKEFREALQRFMERGGNGKGEGT